MATAPTPSPALHPRASQPRQPAPPAAGGGLSDLASSLLSAFQQNLGGARADSIRRTQEVTYSGMSVKATAERVLQYYHLVVKPTLFENVDIPPPFAPSSPPDTNPPAAEDGGSPSRATPKRQRRPRLYRTMRQQGLGVVSRPEAPTDGGVLVTAVGDFNRGKTYVLSKLMGVDLPTGLSVNTEGLSFRHREVRGRSVWMLDTAGAGAPVEHITEEAMQDKEAEENILRTVAFEMSDVFIYVVNHMTSREQREIHKISRALSQQRRTTKMFVVHNLREATMEEEVEAYFEKLQGMHGVNLVREKAVVQLANMQQEIVFLDGKEMGTDPEVVYGEYLEQQVHFVIGREGEPAGKRNNAVMEYILATIAAPISKTQQRNILASIQKAFERVMRLYAVPRPNEREFRFEAYEAVPCETYQTQRLVMLTEVEDQPKFTDASFSQQLETIVNRGSVSQRKVTTNTELILYYDLPGCDDKGIKLTKRPKRNQQGEALFDVEARREERVLPNPLGTLTDEGSLGSDLVEFTLAVPADYSVSSMQKTVELGTLKVTFLAE